MGGGTQVGERAVWKLSAAVGRGGGVTKGTGRKDISGLALVTAACEEMV